jgi:hypothetical protein
VFTASGELGSVAGESPRDAGGFDGTKASSSYSEDKYPSRSNYSSRSTQLGSPGEAARAHPARRPKAMPNRDKFQTWSGGHITQPVREDESWHAVEFGATTPYQSQQPMAPPPGLTNEQAKIHPLIAEKLRGIASMQNSLWL